MLQLYRRTGYRAIFYTLSQLFGKPPDFTSFFPLFRHWHFLFKKQWPRGCLAIIAIIFLRKLLYQTRVWSTQPLLCWFCMSVQFIEHIVYFMHTLTSIARFRIRLDELQQKWRRESFQQKAFQKRTKSRVLIWRNLLCPTYVIAVSIINMLYTAPKIALSRKNGRLKNLKRIQLSRACTHKYWIMFMPEHTTSFWLMPMPWPWTAHR